MREPDARGRARARRGAARGATRGAAGRGAAPNAAPVNFWLPGLKKLSQLINGTAGVLGVSSSKVGAPRAVA